QKARVSYATDSRGSIMEMNSQKTKKSNNGPHPLWIGLGFGGATFVLAIIGVTLLQFFLQFTLAAGFRNTSEFWIQGIFISLIFGSVLGIPVAVVVGLVAAGAAWLIRAQKRMSSCVLYRISLCLSDLQSIWQMSEMTLR
ncbi:MAG: hypothetical protein ACXW4U_07990, partial [Anaerolineales bacterium]